MARYSLRIRQSAAREMEAISRKIDRRRTVQRVRVLGDDQRPRGCEKLTGHNDRFRIRHGPFRIVDWVDDDSRVVEIFGVGHRREVDEAKDVRSDEVIAVRDVVKAFDPPFPAPPAAGRQHRAVRSGTAP